MKTKRENESQCRDFMLHTVYRRDKDRRRKRERTEKGVGRISPPLDHLRSTFDFDFTEHVYTYYYEHYEKNKPGEKERERKRSAREEL